MGRQLNKLGNPGAHTLLRECRNGVVVAPECNLRQAQRIFWEKGRERLNPSAQPWNGAEMFRTGFGHCVEQSLCHFGQINREHKQSRIGERSQCALNARERTRTGELIQQDGTIKMRIIDTGATRDEDLCGTRRPCQVDLADQ
ncbi:MAG: hypothetical protein WAM85_16815 [Terracidiphilus sp.]